MALRRPQMTHSPLAFFRSWYRLCREIGKSVNWSLIMMQQCECVSVARPFMDRFFSIYITPKPSRLFLSHAENNAAGRQSSEIWVLHRFGAVFD
jgi:hypothetical protein